MELAPARKHSTWVDSSICRRPADRRTLALGMVMRATATVRTNSSGSRSGSSASGAPGAGLAHAHDAAAADVDAGPAHVAQRVQPVLVVAGGDDVAVQLGRGVQVVVVVVQTSTLEALRLVAREHAQGAAGLQALVLDHAPQPLDLFQVAVVGRSPGGTHAEARGAGR